MDVRFARRMAEVRPSAIRDLLRLGADPELISFGGGYPDPALFPMTELRHVVDELLSGGNGGFGKKGLSGRSARLVVTMGMPALVYRYFFRAHSVKSLERNVLGFVGIAPVHETLIGMVDKLDAPAVQKWLDKLRDMGRKAE